MAKPVPTAYASLIAPLPEFIADRGGRPERVFDAVGLPIELAVEPERVIPLRSYFDLMHASARELGDAHVGMALADGFPVEALGPYGRLIAGEPTLERVIATTNELAPLYSPALRLWLVDDGDTVRWCYRVDGRSDQREGVKLDTELALVQLRDIVRLALGPAWQPALVFLDGASAAELRGFEARFGAPARAVNGTSALVLPRGALALPLTRASPLTPPQRRALVAQLQGSAPESSFAGSVKAIARGLLSGGQAEIAAVARATDLSVRTLQRQIADEGTTFSALVGAARREVARDLLAAEPPLQLIEVAMAVGYSDPANFTRAFKEWTGVTPSAYRRALRRPGTLSPA